MFQTRKYCRKVRYFHNFSKQDGQYNVDSIKLCRQAGTEYLQTAKVHFVSDEETLCHEFSFSRAFGTFSHL